MGDHSAHAFFTTKKDKLQDLPYEKYSKAASDAALEKTVKALEAKTHKVTVVHNKAEALEAIKKLVPAGSSVMNAGSTTLGEIGLTDYLKTQTEWNNWHAKILAAYGTPQEHELRKQALLADYYFSSVSAITEEGSLLVCDLTGTRTGAFIQAAGHVIIVAGTNKIVPNHEEAERRQKEYCLPLESVRANLAYGVPGSAINNSVAIHAPNPWGAPGRFHFILVKESLGY